MAIKEQLQIQAQALTLANLIANKYGATIDHTTDQSGNHILNFTGNRPGTSAQLAREIADTLHRYSV